MVASTDHLAGQEEQLVKRLERAGTLEEAALMAQGWLAELADIRGEYLRSLVLRQAKLARRFIAVLEVCCDALKAVRPIVRQERERPAPQRLSSFQWLVAKIAWAVGLRATAAAAETPSSGLGAGGDARPLKLLRRVLAPIVGGIQVAVSWLVRIVDLRVATPAAAAALSQPAIDIDAEALKTALGEAFELIDRTVERVEPPAPPPEKCRLTDHIEMLESLQQLLGDAHREDGALPPHTRDNLRYLTTELESERIEVRFFDDGREPIPGLDRESMFEVQQSFDPRCQEYTTLLPCFVSEDRVLLRGSVVGPAVLPENGGLAP